MWPPLLIFQLQGWVCLTFSPLAPPHPKATVSSMASLCPLRVFLPCFQSPASAAHTKLLIGWWTFVEHLLIWALVRWSSSCFEFAQGSPLVKLEGGPQDAAVSYHDYSFTRALSALALLTPWARSFFLWACPVCQGMFSNIPGP